MTMLKICGMTNPNHVRLAASKGVSMLGFILVPTSPRYCHPEHAGLYIKWLREHYPKTKSVVVLVSDSPDEIAAIHKTLKPDFIQLHTTLKADAFNKLNISGLIKVFLVSGPLSETEILAYKAQYFLFDTFKKGQQGGTGQQFDWSWIPKSVLPKAIIAGGLRPEDILPIALTYHPYAVDLNSTLELTRGIKSPARVERAIRLWKKTPKG